MNSARKIPAWLNAHFVTNEQNIFSLEQKNYWDALQQEGLPTVKNESWQYTDISFLYTQEFSLAKRIDVKNNHSIKAFIHEQRAQKKESIFLIFINGYFVEEYSDLNKLPDDFVITTLHKAQNQYGETIKKYWPNHIDAKKHPFANLNLALSDEPLFFYFPKQKKITQPIHLLSITLAQENLIIHPQHFFLIDEQSEIILTEESFSLGNQACFTNKMLTMIVAKDAILHYYKMQNESKNAIHLAHTFIQQEKNSDVKLMNFSLGSRFARDDMVIQLLAQGANCDASGFYHLTQDQQYIDHHVDIIHQAARSRSNLLYKGILEKKSRAVFNGKVTVDKNAQMVLAQQINHNLLLSQNAEIYSKPELEIYADEVKCKHGSTVGQLDPEALFYLCSRGISHEAAIAMLLHGFADEVIDRIVNPEIKKQVLEQIKC